MASERFVGCWSSAKQFKLFTEYHGWTLTIPLDDFATRPYRGPMISAPRSFYVYSYYYGYPSMGRGWRRTRD